QINPKSQISNIESLALAQVWSLGVEASLGFGVWCLEFSFVSQRFHRIDARGAPRRQPTCQGSHGNQKHRDCGQRRWIRWVNAEEQAAQRARQSACAE